PEMARSRVVLPAPLLPSTATTAPLGTSSDTSRSARTGPYVTRRPCTVSMAVQPCGTRPDPASCRWIPSFGGLQVEMDAGGSHGRTWRPMADPPAHEVLLNLDAEYAEILGMLDGS